MASFLQLIGQGGSKAALVDRTIFANNDGANAHYADNIVITSKYTWYNFAPLFLLEQFARFANFYFLVVAIMQTIPEITITGGIPTNFLPLSFVLFFDGVVTALEDYKRHVDDAKANGSRTLALRGGKFTDITWADVRVGDILKLVRNAPVPADCVFLSSFSPDADTPDTCYVQTAQLDGETNLKLRQAVPASVARFKNDADAASFRGHIVCEAPNAAFDKFVGMLHMQDGESVSPTGIGLEMAHRGNAEGESMGRPIPLEAEQILLRGSILRNVDYAYGIVVYTGRETKVRVRQSSRPVKRAQIEAMLNQLILCLITLLATLCVVGAVGSTIWTNANDEAAGAWYLRLARMSVRRGVEQAATYFLLNASFIPVSLYVTVRLARSFQMLFMERDAAMFHSEPDLVRSSGGLEGEYPFKVRTMDLNDELGQITHIFSDKTGTLTLNYMEYRKMLVGAVTYGLGTTQIGVDRLRREGADVRAVVAALEAEKIRGKVAGTLPHVNFEDGSDSHPDRTLAADAASPSDGGQGTAIHHFLLHLALNHTVLPEVVRDSNGAIVGSRLSASSPDEEAFLYAAQSFGYKFTSRTHDSLTVRCHHPASTLPFAFMKAGTATPAILARNVPVTRSAAAGVDSALEWPQGVDLLFRNANILAYTQERKRMSVIIEHPVRDAATGRMLGCTGQGEMYLYCKGADSVILPRLRPPSDEASAEVVRRNKRQLAEWGNDGLRTLVFASRPIPAQEYKAWAARYSAACTNMEEVRKRKNKQPNAIDSLQDEIESSLTLQGATANEDKLQPEVPETIALLAKGGVKLWMVTGDKQETAVNIGFATRLLDDTMRQIVVTAESAGGVSQAMKRLRIAAKRMRAERRLDKEAAAAQKAKDSGVGQNMAGATAWLTKQLEAIEQQLGLDAQHDKPTEIDIDATAAANDEAGQARAGSGLLQRVTSMRFPSSRGLAAAGGTSGGTAPYAHGPGLRSVSPSVSVGASRDGSVSVSLTEMAARDRAVSFDSEDGEEHLVESEIRHVKSHSHAHAQVGQPQSTLRNLAHAGAEVMSNPMKGHGEDVTAFPPSTATIQLASSLLAQPLSLAPQRRPFALVIDEGCLDAALSHPRARAYLLYVAVNCSAVIACRARPDQKAQVVRLIRSGVPSSRTLAVGDGANDVDMIGNAHVGVGIAGAEGVQAANASDYAIGRFRFLQRLLLVHGRWNYLRMTKAVLYMFWKNIVFVFAQFVFQWYNGFSGQKWYIEYAAQVFNLLYTGLPVLIMAVYDRDVSDKHALKYPKLYDVGRLNRGLNLKVFGMWALDAVFSALVISFFTMNGFTHPDSHAGRAYGDPIAGSTPYIFSMGSVTLTSVVVIVSLRIAAESYAHNWFVQVSLIGSVAMWPISCFVFDAMRQDGMLGGSKYLWSSAAFYLTVLLTTGLLGAKMAGWKAYKRAYMPDFRHIVQEVAWSGGSEDKIEEFAEAVDLARRTGRGLAEVLDAERLAEVAARTLAPGLAAQSKAAAAAGASGGASFTPFHQRAVMAAAGSPSATSPAPTSGTSSSSSTDTRKVMPIALSASRGSDEAAVQVHNVAAGYTPRPDVAVSIGMAAQGLVSPDTLAHTRETARVRILEGALLPRHITADEMASGKYDPSADFDTETVADGAAARAGGNGSGQRDEGMPFAGHHLAAGVLTDAFENAMMKLRERMSGKDARSVASPGSPVPRLSLHAGARHTSAGEAARAIITSPGQGPGQGRRRSSAGFEAEIQLHRGRRHGTVVVVRASGDRPSTVAPPLVPSDEPEGGRPMSMRSFEAEDVPTIRRMLYQAAPPPATPQRPVSSSAGPTVGTAPALASLLNSTPNRPLLLSQSYGEGGRFDVTSIGVEGEGESPGRPGDRSSLRAVLASVDMPRGVARVRYIGHGTMPGGATPRAAFSVEEQQVAIVAHHYSTYGQLMADVEASREEALRRE